MTSPEHDHGYSLLRAGAAAQAAEHFKRLIARKADDAFAYAGYGAALIQLGKEAEAWDALARACRLSDRATVAFAGLAWLAQKQGNADMAASLAQHALALEPDDAGSRFVLARALFAQGAFDAAEREFARASTLDAQYARARDALGDDAFQRGRFAAAARHFAASVQRPDADARAWFKLGASLARAGDVRGAREALERAVALAPQDAAAAAALATVLIAGGAGNPDLLPALEHAVALAPDNGEMRLNLARALMADKRYAEAKPHLRAILARDPNCLPARWLDFQRPDAAVADASTQLEYLPKWRAGMAYFEALDWSDERNAQQADAILAGSTNYHLPYLGLPLREEQQRNAAMLRRLTLLAAAHPEEVPIRPIGHKRRKIAVFSPSLGHAHSVGRVWAPTLQRLDAEAFDVAVYSPEPRDAADAPRWQAAGVAFLAEAKRAGAWIETLRAFAPDILLFPDIGMHQIVQAIASLRLAPVQATTWGHPLTSGMQTIDFFLGADAFEPPDGAAHYTEALVRLPRLGVWLEPLPAPTAPSARDDAALALLCAQSADKLHPAHDALFARVLAALPAARLTVLSGATPENAAVLAARLRAAFGARGIEFDARCRVLPRVPLHEFRQHVANADLSLDSLDFSGCISSLECLWHGLPIVTLPGPLARGRQTAGLLRLCGVPELIASSHDDYVRIATELGRDAGLRARSAERLRAGRDSLFEDAGAVDALNAFLRTVEHPSLAAATAAGAIGAGA